MLRLEDLKDRILAENSKFVIGVDLDEIKKGLLKKEKGQMDPRPPRSFLVSRRWWQYRPKLPYTYFLSKLRRLEVCIASQNILMTMGFLLLTCTKKQLDFFLFFWV